ncbi:MAG: FAD:protein FMN transferase [Planctomycetota bacterium]|jgi:thiamine biosynthesis lipoprotein|nr:FAD:protein FMN transferase [Planctomycetota bacterium]
MPESSAFPRRAGNGGSVFLLALLAGLAAYFLVVRWFGADDDPVDRGFQVMNTHARVVVPEGTSEFPPSKLADMAVAAIREVDRLMSPFGEESDVRRLNAAEAGEWVEVSPETWTVVMDALRWHRLSGGAFDPTIGPLKRLFRFDGGELRAWPDETALAEARSKVGAQKLRFEREGMRLIRERPGMLLDLGAIAKGYAVDRAIEVLLRENVASALVEVGGEIRTIGMKGGPGGRPWRTGVRDPRKDDVLAVMEMSGGAVATSGDYESFFLFDGKRYQHIIDPRTGMPLTGAAASVTVRHPTSCMAADALATTLVVLGPDAGAEFLRGQALGLFSEGVEVDMLFLGEGDSLKRIFMSVDREGNFSSPKETPVEGWGVAG